MGNNCTCLNSKDVLTELIVHKKRTKSFVSYLHPKVFLFNNIVNNSPRNNSELLIFSIIRIQSVFRGYNIRNKFLKNKTLFNSSFLKTTENLPYSSTKNNIITNEEIHNLFKEYPQIKDKKAIICLKAIEYSNGCQYYGEWNQKNNQKHGRGIQKWKEGPMYYGYFKADKANGKGKFIFTEGEIYEGNWVDNRATGLGKYISKEVIYEGEWKNDMQNGVGTETWDDGTVYIGEFKEGQKTGEGKFIYNDGSNYVGNFLNNNFHGKGKYIWIDGREYEGDWKNNKIDGEGIFKWKDGRKYIGQYKNDKKDGYGIFEWPSGKKYKGFWKNGKQNGEGEIYDIKNKKWIKGFWKDGKKV